MRFLLYLGALLVALVHSHDIVKRQSAKIDELADNERRVVCYYTNWSVYRKGPAKYLPQNINPYLCTHLIYAFGGITDDFEVTTFDEYQDIEKGGYSQFNGLKQYNKGMKTLLALGGWNEGSARFSEMVAYREYRDNFTRSAIKHLRRYNFDGLDLDWEYPAAREGSAPEDKDNYATLVEELRAAFDEEGTRVKKGRLLLTMAVPAGLKYIDQGYDVPRLDRNLDFINILSYDYHSTEEPNVNHHAPLLAQPGASEYEWNAKLNVDATIKHYISKGASRTKLVMGIPTYGRTFTLLDGDFPELGASANGPGIKGNFTNEKGYMSFYEVCTAIAVDGWTVRKPYPKRIGPFAFKGNQWVGYDDENIAAKKAEYVREEGLGGIMFWALDSDDFRGQCNGQQYPLIESAKRALFALSDVAENEARSLQALADQQQVKTKSEKVPGRGKRPGGRRGQGSRTTIHPLITPEPPTTPASAAAFTCKREGFQPNPADCHKYFWCLSSGASGLGIVPHAFTCPPGLIFNKKINGCDNPSTTVKCGGRVRKGPSQKVTTTTPIPTTTPFDYTLQAEYDYYYYDYIDEEEPVVIPTKKESPKKEPTKKQPVVKESVPARNSAGNQFRGRPKTPVIEDKPAPAKPQSPRNRSRPQYASIARDRSEPPAQEEVVEDTRAEEKETPSRSRRPQYTTLDRNRPASQQEEPETSVPVDSRDSVTERTLEYVTIIRQRPAQGEEDPAAPTRGQVESTTRSGGLQYVTLSRNRPTIDEVIEDPLLELERSDSVSPATLPEENIIVTSKPQIRVPPSFSRSRDRRPLNRKTEQVKPEPRQPTPPVSVIEPEIVEVEPVEPRIIEEKPIKVEEEPAIIEVEAPTLQIQPVELIVKPAVLEVNPEIVTLEADVPNEVNTNLVSTTEESRNEPSETDLSAKDIIEVLEPEKDEFIEPARAPTNRLIPTRNINSRPSAPAVTARPLSERRRLPSRTRRPVGRRPAATQVEEPSVQRPRPASRRPGFSRLDEPVVQTPRPRTRRPLEASRRRPHPRARPNQRESLATTSAPTTVAPTTAAPTTTAPTTAAPTTAAPTTAAPVVERPEDQRIRNPFTALEELSQKQNENEKLVEDSPTSFPEFVERKEPIVLLEETPPPVVVKEVQIVKAEEELAAERDVVAKESLSPSRQDLFDRWSTTTEESLPEAEKDSMISDTSVVTTTPETRTSQRTTERNFRGLRPRPVVEKKADQTSPFSFSDILSSSVSRTQSNPAATTTTTTTQRTTPQRTTQPSRNRGTQPPARTTPRSTPSPRVTRPATVHRLTPRLDPPTTANPNVRPRSSTEARPTEALEYDYVYDYYNSGALGGQLGELAGVTKKAVLSSDGAVTCFDTGYFAHPETCKKFISCSKTVRGNLKGWIYTCPQQLVFDPVGGMCNWAEDVDCLGF